MTMSIAVKEKLRKLIDEINEHEYYGFLFFEKDKMSSFVINRDETLAKITFLESNDLAKVNNYVNLLINILSAAQPNNDN